MKAFNNQNKECIEAIDKKNSRFSISLFVIESVKPFGIFIASQFLVAVIMAIDMSFRPYLIKVILNMIPDILASQALSMLYLPVTLYIAMSILVVLIFNFYEWILLHFHPNLKKHIGLILMNRMMNHSQHFYQNHFSGNISNKINDVTTGIPSILNTIIDRFFSNILALLIAIYTVGTVELKFGLGLGLWSVIFLIASVKLSKKAKTLSKEAAKVRSTITGYIVDILSNIVSVRLFGGKKSEAHYLHNIYNSSVQVEQRRDSFFMRIHTLQETSFVIFQAICFWWLIAGIQNHTITSGDFALIMMLNIATISCLQRLSKNIREFAESYGNVIQGLEIIHANLEVQDKDDAQDILVTKGEIVFENVQFYYSSCTPIFNNICVRIPPAQKLGLVGYSGAGKSTFVNLILRLFDITQGRILIDNQDIRVVTQESLRSAIGIIPQDIALFNRMLMENIRYGRIDASDNEVVSAAKQAHAHEFISNLPAGYKTLVGERGVKLSGGERQRIAIARAILKNAPILILDEGTSQLDSVTECNIQESFWNLMQGKTTIVIAHRLSTLLHLDRILVFDSGKIIQDGTHADLILKNGLYKTLWDNQSHGFLQINNTNAMIADEKNVSTL